MEPGEGGRGAEEGRPDQGPRLRRRGGLRGLEGEPTGGRAHRRENRPCAGRRAGISLAAPNHFSVQPGIPSSEQRRLPRPRAQSSVRPSASRPGRTKAGAPCAGFPDVQITTSADPGSPYP